MSYKCRGNINKTSGSKCGGDVKSSKRRRHEHERDVVDYAVVVRKIKNDLANRISTGSLWEK